MVSCVNGTLVWALTNSHVAEIRTMIVTARKEYRRVNMSDPPAKMMVGAEIIPERPQKRTKLSDDSAKHEQ